MGLAALLATTATVQHDRVGPGEARAFGVVNGLPDSMYLPALIVMQLGAFGAIPASAAAAWLAGDGELAGRLQVGGTATWALAKGVRPAALRGRPGQPDVGPAFIGEVDLSTLNDQRLTILRRDRVGFVFQALNLVPTISAAKNVTCRCCWPTARATRRGSARSSRPPG